MDSVTLYNLITAFLLIIVGFVVGWLSDVFNRAKAWRLLGRFKYVVLVVSGQGITRSFLVDLPVSTDAIKIQVKGGFRKIVQELVYIPNPDFNGNYKTIPFGVFDAKDCRQLPLSQYAYFLGVEQVKDKDGKVLSERQVWKNNMEVLEKLLPPAKIQNILSTNASANRIKARNEQSQDNKQNLMLFIAAVASVVTLFLVAYAVIQINANLNTTGAIGNFLSSVNQTVTYKAT